MSGTFPFEVDTTTDVPLWVQLRQRLIYLINSGYFKPGDQLPTVRGLASEISINYNTVNKAYLSLVSDGYLESTRGRGVFVRNFDAEADEEYATEVDGILEDCVSACRELGLSLDDVQKCMERKIKRMKKAEGIGSGAANAANAANGAGGTGGKGGAHGKGGAGERTARIVEVDVGGKVRARQAKAGA